MGETLIHKECKMSLNMLGKINEKEYIFQKIKYLKKYFFIKIIILLLKIKKISKCSLSVLPKKLQNIRAVPYSQAWL